MPTSHGASSHRPLGIINTVSVMMRALQWSNEQTRSTKRIYDPERVLVMRMLATLGE